WEDFLSEPNPAANHLCSRPGNALLDSIVVGLTLEDSRPCLAVELPRARRVFAEMESCLAKLQISFMFVPVARYPIPMLILSRQGELIASALSAVVCCFVSKH